MPRRALRPSFVVTFALGATAIAGGCSSTDSSHGNGSIGDGSIGDTSIGDGGCPVGMPAQGDPCDLPSSTTCDYAVCQPGCPFSPSAYASCYDGGWLTFFCNPPNASYCVPEAGPGVDDAAPDVSDAGADVLDGGTDSEGQDGGHD